jgi:hypothetical protein
MQKSLLLRVVFWVSFSLGLTSTAHAQNEFSFIALGDLPYGAGKNSFPPYVGLINRINQLSPAFSIHVGDFKSGSTLCSDEEFGNQLKHFQLFSGAVVYTPGDNEWTDCHRKNNGSYEPLERLNVLRKMFFKPRFSLGQKPMQLESHSEVDTKFSMYVENQRWEHNDVLFTTVHVVGSNNNFESRDPSAIREFFEREEANVSWIKDAFVSAKNKNIKVLVFAFQADVFESKSAYEDFPASSGFKKTIGDTLLPLAQEWGKPVLIIHGDSHRFKADQPFTINRKPLNNVTRLVVPGADDVRAVKVTLKGSEINFTLIQP